MKSQKKKRKIGLGLLTIQMELRFWVFVFSIFCTVAGRISPSVEWFYWQIWVYSERSLLREFYIFCALVATIDRNILLTVRYNLILAKYCIVFTHLFLTMFSKSSTLLDSSKINHFKEFSSQRVKFGTLHSRVSSKSEILFLLKYLLNIPFNNRLYDAAKISISIPEFVEIL